MKPTLLYTNLVLLLFVAMAQGQPVSLSLVVRVESGVENKGVHNETKTQHRKLDILLSNVSQEPVENVRVNWWFFARNLKSGEEAVLKRGSSKAITVGALGKESVESDNVTSTYEDKHAERVPTKGKAKSEPKFKTVPASGQKITGYAVQVVSKGQIVAEYYSAPSYKARVGGTSE